MIILYESRKNCTLFKIYFIDDCTEGGTRTPTGLHPPDFESGASTNSATPANQFYVPHKLFN